MNEAQKQYYESQLMKFSTDGNCTHSAYVIDKVFGMGSNNLGPVSPPVVGFSNDYDPHYVTYLRNWREVNELIAQIVSTATEAFGEENDNV